MSDNWVKKILGKAIKKEQSPYSLPKIVELHEAYKSAIVFLVPRSEAIPETELRKQVTEQTEEMAKQTDKIATLEEDVRKLFNLAKMLASELPDKQKKKKA